ncbi:DUF2155 domain-containing protein [Aurantiacibacter sp. MUD11]|uniref:DUF2155 domain-containing protein n=1 Tax=Aurantiacibacter sp. MUD11 TaxID=3003265 RepID=UPI0022AB4297|nr:DUF2155 domain-containing protein [Aurantiacibacter sp. MUD11]WAT17489.1 DUF2155 domain-containing protein [Aurantiacibacter sp. MUD11]
MSPLRAVTTGAALLAPILLLAACNSGAPEPEAEETEIPEEFASDPLPDLSEVQGQGTPMEERVATIGLINKRNNRSRDLEMSPGESRRVDDIIVRLAACERTAPWESPAETGAFVQVFVNERESVDADPQWMRIFSGWMFKNSPSLNVVEHPVYDVWVKDCAMSFPGEEG